MGCSIWRWYEGNKAIGEEPFAINSVIEGSITLIKNPNEKGAYKARIVTDELEKQKKCFECAVEDHARKVLEYEAEYQPKGEARHYGLIVVRPGRPKLKDSTVVDFISFHRHPLVDTELPTMSRYGVPVYNEVFETRALKEGALKKLGESDHDKLQQFDRNALEKVIKERVLKSLGGSDRKKPQQLDRIAIEKVVKEVMDQLEDAVAHR